MLLRVRHAWQLAGRRLAAARALSAGAAGSGEIHRLYRFENSQGQARMGIARGAAVLGVGDDIDVVDGEHLAAWLRSSPGAPGRVGRALVTSPTRPRDRIARLLAPLPFTPPAIFGVGLNYRKHATEAGLPLPAHPIYFMVPPSSLCGPGDAIVVPRCAQEPPEADYEAELAIVIGRDAKDVPAEEALRYVLGYTVANDVSARRWQGPKRGGGQWCRAKSFDTFTPVGPALTLVDDSGVGGITAAGGALSEANAVAGGGGRTDFGSIGGVDPDDLAVRTTLNGATMQQSRTSDMVFTVAQIIASLSRGTTLQAGSLILTGTPEGVGFTRDPPVWLRDGDEVTVAVESLGELRNPVTYE